MLYMLYGKENGRKSLDINIHPSSIYIYIFIKNKARIYTYIQPGISGLALSSRSLGVALSVCDICYTCAQTLLFPLFITYIYTRNSFLRYHIHIHRVVVAEGRRRGGGSLCRKGLAVWHNASGTRTHKHGAESATGCCRTPSEAIKS